MAGQARPTVSQMDTDRQTDRQTGRQTDRQTDQWIEAWTTSGCIFSPHSLFLPVWGLWNCITCKWFLHLWLWKVNELIQQAQGQGDRLRAVKYWCKARQHWPLIYIVAKRYMTCCIALVIYSGEPRANEKVFREGSNRVSSLRKQSAPISNFLLWHIFNKRELYNNYSFLYGQTLSISSECLLWTPLSKNKQT